MVKILDTTLREGEQTPGVCFSAPVKTAIAEMLDELGIDILEVGHPAVTVEIRDAVRAITEMELNVLAGAHSRSLKSDVDLALEYDIGFLGIFYCVSDERLGHHARDLNRAVSEIAGVIRYAKEQKPNLLIRYTPEDTVRTTMENVLSAASEAVRAGADIISVADTTGYMIPGTPRSMYDFVSRLKEGLAARDLHPMIAVHCHNDRGLALANALDGHGAGADIIDATVLGLGERAGLVDLATLLTVLSTDFEGNDGKWNLEALPRLYEVVSRYANFPIPSNFPLMGKSAFTHCAGVHTQAAIKNPLHYQSLDPKIVGRRPTIALDHMAGLSAIRFSLEKIGEPDLDKDQLHEVLHKVKEMGQKGRTVELDEFRFIVNYVKKERNGLVPRLPDDSLCL